MAYNKDVKNKFQEKVSSLHLIDELGVNLCFHNVSKVKLRPPKLKDHKFEVSFEGDITSSWLGRMHSKKLLNLTN